MVINVGKVAFSWLDLVALLGFSQGVRGIRFNQTFFQLAVTMVALSKPAEKTKKCLQKFLQAGSESLT